MAIVFPCVRGAEAKTPLEPLVQREPVDRAAVAMALVRHEQAASPSGTDIDGPETVHHPNDDVVIGERRDLSISEAANGVPGR